MVYDRHPFLPASARQSPPATIGSIRNNPTRIILPFNILHSIYFTHSSPSPPQTPSTPSKLPPQLTSPHMPPPLRHPPLPHPALANPRQQTLPLPLPPALPLPLLPPLACFLRTGSLTGTMPPRAHAGPPLHTHTHTRPSVPAPYD